MKLPLGFTTTVSGKIRPRFTRPGQVTFRWLSEQPQGWLASHRLIKTVRWDTVDQIPPLDSSGRTRLVPPKAEYRAQLSGSTFRKTGLNWLSRPARCFARE